MNIERHLTHRILWRAREGQDSWGETFYSEPVELPARWEEKSRSMPSVGGASAIRATNNVYVYEDVGVGDMVALYSEEVSEGSSEPDYHEVEARESIEDVRGNTVSYILYFEPVGRT